MLFDFTLIRLLNIGQLTILKFSNPDFPSCAFISVSVTVWANAFGAHSIYN